MAEKIIEIVFNKFLVGDTLKNALDFAECLRENNMTYDGEYEIHYKDKLMCYIDMPNEKSHSWRVWTVGNYKTEYEEISIDERTKEVAWANVVYCGNCDDCDLDPGKTEMIFGKEFTNVCNGTDDLAMRFANPNDHELRCIKKLVKMRKHFIDSNS